VSASTAASLSNRLLAGDRSALARLISWAENGDARFGPALDLVYARIGSAARTGFTGPPGAGKSTLVNEVAKAYRASARTVGILAVDPSSPFSGGALLGDRIRMEERTLDPGVFIRSMASRESRGGMAQAAVDACDAMDAFGLEELLIETVGVGQAEYDVVAAADTVVVVLCPGAGDGIQAMKAGLLEVADVLVVNKSDLSGADRLCSDLEEAVHVRMAPGERFAVPVVCVCASNADGVPELIAAIAAHRAWLDAHDLAGKRLDKRIERVRQSVDTKISRTLWSERGWREYVRAQLASGAPPQRVAHSLAQQALDSIPKPSEVLQ
jgi:LAO/AO transport system kinase